VGGLVGGWVCGWTPGGSWVNCGVLVVVVVVVGGAKGFVCGGVMRLSTEKGFG
jgi:hypothetical protein